MCSASRKKWTTETRAPFRPIALLRRCDFDNLYKSHAACKYLILLLSQSALEATEQWCAVKLSWVAVL
ncbi:hypothetical protein V5799_027363 [Amblyomma americanum]|uniref:Uncharacterized protein n=1 Tax=Amblyomma americanum TaxID=6943 RepID=A0AAQ4DFY1_AMBAM